MIDRTEVSDEFRDSQAATEKQIAFVRTLKAERDLSGLDVATRDWVDEIELDCRLEELNKTQISRLIEKLLALPRKPAVQTVEHPVPAGRYAIENNDGELRFYKVWISPDTTRIIVYVEHGPDNSRLPWQAAIIILHKIAEVGIREAAIRYGIEIGACSKCGRRLTNRISRELGIGPVCGGRMFGGDGWKDEVKAKRAEISARGEDPDEDIN